MRGKVYDWDIKTLADGITPAYAGKRIQEKTKRQFQLGSPPPMRGKAFSSFANGMNTGITPAYAGKRDGVCGTRSKLEDHPRLCGEKSNAPFKAFGIKGSPPPMRGKADDGSTGNPKGRITPAYAGKRGQKCRRRNREKDHPRLCGEKCSTRRIIPADRGSPPPMRGKALGDIATALADRITPAYAGKSVLVPLVSSPYQDHPRLCGEKCRPLSTSRLHRGSPPPMRGKD